MSNLLPTAPSVKPTSFSSSKVTSNMKVSSLIIQQNISLFGSTPVGQQSVDYDLTSIVNLLRSYNLANDPFIGAVGPLIGTGSIGTARQGWSVSISKDESTAIVGGDTDNDNVGAAWIFVRNGDTWSQQAKLIGTGYTGTNNIFQGESTGLSSDGNTAVVGGPYDNVAVGAIWIFVRIGTIWTQQAGPLIGTGYIGVDNIYQGWASAISADGNTVVSGGLGHNSDLGAVWVFVRNGTSWSQQGGPLVGTGGTTGAYQGWSVDISSDGNNIVSGGPTDNTGGTNVGAVWVFVRNGAVWSQQAGPLIGTLPTGGSQQGLSVSIYEDTIAVGGPNNFYNRGNVWVFVRNGTTWTQEVALINGSGQETGDTQQQGFSVSLSKDKLVFGGPGYNSNIGAIWIFTRTNGLWTQKYSRITGSGFTGVPQQGYSVSSSENYVIVGGYKNNFDEGAIWIFNV